MDGALLNEAGERVERRRLLMQLIQESHPEKTGALLLLSGFEREREQFYQDSSFEYFVGLQEPAVMLYQLIGQEATLFMPNYAIDRSVWLPKSFDEEQLASLGIKAIELMGQKIQGYATGPVFEKTSLENLIKTVKAVCDAGESIFTPVSSVTVECQWVLQQLCQFVPALKKQLINIDPLVAQLRRTKSQHELEHLYMAAEITTIAQEAAAGVIRKGALEQDVQAAIEFVFTESGATKAFASVVGSGVNSTILHYVDNKAPLPDNGLVVVDIGASINHYCSDVTRTYPVAGKFNKRQKQVYQDVLDCQSYIADLAKPGMYLRNKQKPEKCLNSLAHAFLQKRGYHVEKEFPHGIGHFVGLDVHDVGDVTQPLAPGDIITIEPGIYLRDEQLGVRIEDVYWIVKEGAVCLTEQVPKEIEEIEQFMRSSELNGFYDNHKVTGPDEH